MKIALINPPYIMEKVSETGMPSIGQGYIASYLENRGIKCDMVDFSYTYASNSELIYNNNLLEYHVLGIASYTISFLETVEFIREIKRRKNDMIIFVGGHHASLVPKLILEDFPEIDYVIIGYGEIAVYELLQVLRKKKKIENVKGLAYRVNGEIRMNRDLYQYDLDQLPFPNRWVIDEKGCKKYTIVNNTLTISTSRGCPYSCFYCVNATRSGWQCRSFENVLNEIREVSLIQKFEEIYFVDCNFFVDVKRAICLLEHIYHEFPWISFNIQMRSDQVVNNEWAIAALSYINCRTINIGIESNSLKVLERFNKFTTPEINQNAIDILKKYKINPVTYFIMFEALMDMDDIECNIDFIEKNELITIYNMDNIFNTLMPFVGTPYYTKYGEYYEGSVHSLMRPKFQDKQVEHVYYIIKKFRDEFEDNMMVYMKKILGLCRGDTKESKESKHLCNILMKMNFTILKIAYKEVKENEEVLYEDIMERYGVRKLIRHIESFVDLYVIE